MNAGTMPVKRDRIIREIIGQIDAQMEETFKSYTANREISIASPGKMESRYDTRKYEYGVVADNLARLLEQLRDPSDSIRQYAVAPEGSTVQFGSIVVSG